MKRIQDGILVHLSPNFKFQKSASKFATFGYVKRKNIQVSVCTEHNEETKSEFIRNEVHHFLNHVSCHNHYN